MDWTISSVCQGMPCVLSIFNGLSVSCTDQGFHIVKYIRVVLLPRIWTRPWNLTFTGLPSHLWYVSHCLVNLELFKIKEGYLQVHTFS